MKKLTTFLLIFSVLSSFTLQAQQTAFTVDDALNIESMGSQTLSEDGLYLAGIITDGRSRFGTDHFRFRDPSYLNITDGDLVIINTSTGEELRPFDGRSQVSNLTWSKTADKLIFFQQNLEVQRGRCQG